MATMLALHQTENGGIETMKLGPLPKPSPANNEVLIKVHAASINPVDTKRHYLNIPDTFPTIVGYDVAGIVDSVGADVTRFKPGDRVFGDVMADSVGKKETGTVAEYCVCKEDLLAIIPDGYSFTQAAALPVVVQTAIVAFEMAGAKSGDNVFITGAAGGVGIHTMQVAKNMIGAAQVAGTASAAKAEFVKKYGTDIVIDYKTEDAGEKLKGWADVVIDNTAELDMERKVKKEGVTIVSVANQEADDVKPFFLQADRRKIEKTAELLKEGKVIPVIDTIYPFKDSLKAVQHVADGHAKGKVIVDVTA